MTTGPRPPELLLDWPLSDAAQRDRQSILRSAKRPVILYLRPHNDSQSGARLQFLLFNHLGSRFRVIALADNWSNVISFGEFLFLFLGFSLLATTFGIVFDPRSQHRWFSEVVVPGGLGVAVLYLTELWRRLLGPKRVRTVDFGLLPEGEVPSWPPVARLKASREDDWQPLVRKLATYCHAAVVDVSQPGGKGLLWELQTLPGLLPSRVLLIAEEAAFIAWFKEPPAGAQTASRSEMREALAGRRILVLRGRGRRARRHFGEAVRVALLDLTRQ
jgi:hypothetical protein